MQAEKCNARGDSPSCEIVSPSFPSGCSLYIREELSPIIRLECGRHESPGCTAKRRGRPDEWAGHESKNPTACSPGSKCALARWRTLVEIQRAGMRDASLDMLE